MVQTPNLVEDDCRKGCIPDTTHAEVADVQREVTSTHEWKN